MTCRAKSHYLNLQGFVYSLQWRHNERVSNHQPHDCLLNRLLSANQTKHQRSASLALVTGEFPAQRASNVENVSIWWRHHDVWVSTDNRHVDRLISWLLVKIRVDMIFILNHQNRMRHICVSKLYHHWFSQVMACYLFRTKPLSEPMLTFCQLDPQEQNSEKF